MIYQIYAVLVAVSLILLFYGWYVKADLFRIMGTTLLFILGLMLMPSTSALIGGGGLEYMSGANITTYGNTDIVVNEYTVYTNHTLGFYMTITAVLGIVLVMVERRRDHD